MFPQCATKDNIEEISKCTYKINYLSKFKTQLPSGTFPTLSQSFLGQLGLYFYEIAVRFKPEIDKQSAESFRMNRNIRYIKGRRKNVRPYLNIFVC